MKIFIITIITGLFLPILGELSSKTPDRMQGSQSTLEALDANLLKDYGNGLLSVRGSLASVKATDSKIQEVTHAAIEALDEILIGRDVRSAAKLLPLVDLLHANEIGDGSQLIPGVSNTKAQVLLNYFIGGSFVNEMLNGAADITESRMGEMLRFYSANPAQTSELTWKLNNTMLFVFGNRLVDYLAGQDPDRVATFYREVQSGRLDDLRGPGPDESPASEDNQPTTEEMRTYEDAFNRLELLVKTKSLPDIKMPDLKGQNSSVELPQKSTPPQSEPKKIASTSPELELDKERSPFTLWGVILVLVVASLGFLWFRLKKGR